MVFISSYLFLSNIFGIVELPRWVWFSQPSALSHILCLPNHCVLTFGLNWTEGGRANQYLPSRAELQSSLPPQTRCVLPPLNHGTQEIEKKYFWAGLQKTFKNYTRNDRNCQSFGHQLWHTMSLWLLVLRYTNSLLLAAYFDKYTVLISFGIKNVRTAWN